MADTIRARSVEKAQDSGGNIYKERPEFKVPLPSWDLGARSPSSGALNRKLRVQWLGVNGEWCPVKAETSELHGMERQPHSHHK